MSGDALHPERIEHRHDQQRGERGRELIALGPTVGIHEQDIKGAVACR